MHQIELSYTLGARHGEGMRIRNPLIALLQAVRAQGSIAQAALALNRSYRHVWGELRDWERTLGQPLLAGAPGRPAQLSGFADRLLWAEGQAQARLAAQIEALHAELERAFAEAMDGRIHMLGLHASHDDALVALRAHAAAQARLHLEIQSSGSVDAIRALNQGRCVMAGFHTLEHPPMGSLAQRTYKPLLRPGQHKIIGFARRTQGLMVAPGNPLRLASLADVARTQARFVHRAIGTGTRLLLDELLAQQGIDPARLHSLARCEPSHAAVAQAIRGGAADAGLGIESAARGAGLDFVPLARERYHLACLRAALELPATQALIAVLRSRAWLHRLGTLDGYQNADSGQVQSLRTLLPWWSFRKEKGA